MLKSSISERSGENSLTFYRTRFEVRPDAGADVEIWPQVLRPIARWLEDKEDGKARRVGQSHVEELTSNIEKISDRSERTQLDCWANKQFADGEMELENEGSYIQTRAAFLDGPYPNFWAMDYVEQGDKWYRRWMTNVGISAAEEGSYIVNVRVSIMDDPTFLHDRPKIPNRNTPRFITELFDIRGCTVWARDTRLIDGARTINARNFDSFIEQLTSDKRVMPIVVVTAKKHCPGVFPVDVPEFAKKLRGTAIVYQLDNFDKDTYRKYLTVFGKDSVGSEYRIGASHIRVFFPHVDFSEPGGSNRHYCFNPDEVDRKGAEKIVEDITGSVARTYRRRSGEALDVASVEYILAGLQRKAAEDKFHKIQEQLREARESAFDTSGMHTVEEYERAISELNERHQKELEEQEALYEEYINGLEEMNNDLSGFDVERENLEASIRARDFDIQQLRESRDRALQKASALQAQGSVLRSLEAFPKTPDDALSLAEDAFKERLFIHERAHKTARDFAGRNVDEVFDVLRCLSEVMWPIYFEEDAGNNAEELFYARTGYKFAAGEGEMTRQDSRLMNKRTLDYDGRQIDITAHVKGKPGGHFEQHKIPGAYKRGQKDKKNRSRDLRCA